jgi:ketosteroid isomerase-like protein
MVKAKWKAATLGGSPEEVEAAFYEAMQNRNLDAFMACWADEDDIVCVHPGGPRLVGHDAIRASFEALFDAGAIQAPDGEQEALILATNVYHRTAQGWRLVLHHASPASEQDLQASSDVPNLLH